MLDITRRVWPLFFGITPAMTGNAVQGIVLVMVLRSPVWPAAVD
jgi:hypothetical protein